MAVPSSPVQQPESESEPAPQKVTVYYDHIARERIKACCTDPWTLDYIESLEAIARAARVLYLPPLAGENAVYSLYDTLARVDWMNK